MRITIDTKEDTQDEIRKVMEILSAVTRSGAGTASGGIEPQPVTGEGIFGMFSDKSESSDRDGIATESMVTDSGKEVTAESIIADSGKEASTGSMVIDAEKETMAATPNEEDAGVVLKEKAAGEETGEAKVALTESREENAASLQAGEVSGVRSENKVESVHTPEPEIVENVSRDNDTRIIPY